MADAVRSLVLEAALTGTVLVLAGAELAAPVVALLESAPLPVIAVATGGWNDRWSTSLPITLTAPRLSTAERAEIWRPLLGADPGREISALRLTPEQIGIVGRHATAAAALAGETGLTIERIRSSVRQLGRGRHPRSTEVPAELDDLVLPGRTRAEIMRLLDWARYRDEVLPRGPLQGKGGKGTGICALFSGGPGTGKTLAAHVIADTLGMDLYAVDLAAVVDKYIGETEKNLERVFAEAESLNAVLFFDEADALFGSRSEVKDSRDRYANQEIAYLLQRMEQFDGITVLATNLRGNLDPGVRPPAALHRALPRPGRGDPPPALAAALGAVGDQRSRRPGGRRAGRTRSRWPAATSATSCWLPRIDGARRRPWGCGTSHRCRGGIHQTGAAAPVHRMTRRR